MFPIKTEMMHGAVVIITTKVYSTKSVLSRFQSVRILLLFSIAFSRYSKFLELQLFVTDLKIPCIQQGKIGNE